jgi:uncharacterized membrane protein
MSDEHDSGIPSERTAGKTVDRLLPTGRLEAFSDGVFAIVITLLVLELKVPEAGGDLWRQLVDEWPAYLSYFVSFAFIGASWIAHSNITRFVKAADAALMRLNLLLLLFVSFLPFSTSLMARHLDDAGERLAVVLFGVNLTLAAVLTSIVLRYAGHRRGLAADDVAEAELRGFEKERRVALASLAAATAVGVFLPLVAVVVFLLISVLLLLEPLWRASRAESARVPRSPGTGPAA